MYAVCIGLVYRVCCCRIRARGRWSACTTCTRICFGEFDYVPCACTAAIGYAKAVMWARVRVHCFFCTCPDSNMAIVGEARGFMIFIRLCVYVCVCPWCVLPLHRKITEQHRPYRYSFALFCQYTVCHRKSMPAAHTQYSYSLVFILQHSAIPRTEQLQTFSDPQSMWKVLRIGHILRGTRFKSARRSLFPFKCELHTSGYGYTATRIANSLSREFQEIVSLVMQMREETNPSNETILILERIFCAGKPPIRIRVWRRTRQRIHGNRHRRHRHRTIWASMRAARAS